MAIVRYQPLFSRMLSQWPHWDEDLLPFPSAQRGLEVYETEKEVVVKANVAGVPEEKIELTFEKGVLTIAAQAEEEDQSDRTHYSRTSWSYNYTVAVPGDVDHKREPKAETENGVLTVTFAKSEQSQPKKLKVVRKAA